MVLESLGSSIGKTQSGLATEVSPGIMKNVSIWLATEVLAGIMKVHVAVSQNQVICIFACNSHAGSLSS
jgi:hypothetical protein